MENRVSIKYCGEKAIFENIKLYKIDPTSGFSEMPDSTLFFYNGFEWSFSLVEPCIVRFEAGEGDSTLKYCAYVKPGDSVCYELEDFPQEEFRGVTEHDIQMKFYGTNQGNYNYYYDCYKFYRYNVPVDYLSIGQMIGIDSLFTESYKKNLSDDCYDYHVKERHNNRVLINRSSCVESKDCLVFHPLSLSYYEALKNKIVIEDPRTINSVNIGSPLPNEIIDNTWLVESVSMDTLSFKAILQRNEGLAIYFDIWASWCSPCLNCIRHSSKVKEYLKEQKILVVYLSIDKDIEKWDQCLQNEKMKGEQYLLINGFSSPLGLLFDNTSVPKFFFVNNAHELVCLDAPRVEDFEYEEVKKFINEVQFDRGK